MRKAIAKNKEYQLALLCITLAVLFWGFSYISTKIVLTQIPPISIAFFRQIIAIIILIPWVIHTKSWNKVSFKNIGLLIAASFFGIVMYFILENYGLQLTTASNASMIVSALPIITMMSEALFFKLKVSWKMIFCLVLSICGVYLVVTINGRLDFSSAQLIGNVLVLGAISCWVIYTIFNKRLSRKHSSITITAYQSIASIFLFAPLILPEIHSWPVLKSLKLTSMVNLVFLGMFCSAFAYVCYIYAVKRLGATISAAFLNLVPVVTVVSGFLVLHEKLAMIQLLGMTLIMVSLFTLSRLTPQPARTKKEEQPESVLVEII